MTESEFEQMYAESLARMDAWIATQKTESQISDAKQRKHNVEINRHFFKKHIAEGGHAHICKHCGKLEACTYVEPIKTRLLANGLCFYCDNWEQTVAKADPDRLIIDCHIYKDGGNQPNHPRPHLLGFGGHKWKIERNGVVWETNNLWSGSHILEEHRAALPDNARFVK